MSYVTYEARRSLAPGHAVGVVYTLPLVLGRAERSQQDDKRTVRSMSGRTETLYYGKIVTWSIVATAVRHDLIPLIREFLDSTADGQTFQFNPDSSYEADEIDVIRDDDGYSDDRIVQTGAGSRHDRFAFPFRLREV